MQPNIAILNWNEGCSNGVKGYAAGGGAGVRMCEAQVVKLRRADDAQGRGRAMADKEMAAMGREREKGRRARRGFSAWRSELLGERA
jgi:hypothetical protein